MKKLLAVAMVVVLGMGGTSVWAKNNDKHEKCTDLSYAAYAITHLRQANVPLAEAKKDLKKIMDDDVAVAMLNLAYNQPIGKTKEEKEKIATDIAVQMYKACQNGL